MDGYQVDPDVLCTAADAIRRNATYVEKMADYCQSLSENDGAFGELLQNFRHGYDTASGAQISVFDSMRQKLNQTGEAVDTAARAYDEREQKANSDVKALIDRLESVPIDAPDGGAHR